MTLFQSSVTNMYRKEIQILSVHLLLQGKLAHRFSFFLSSDLVMSHFLINYINTQVYRNILLLDNIFYFRLSIY
jgi:hypothetical protein